MSPETATDLPPASVADDAPHLLVVDDDSRIRTLLSRFLTGHGYRITMAASAADARSRMEGLTFDLLILDDIRRTNPVPILMLTARSDTPDRIAGLEAGVDDYLGKPFEPRELLLRVGSILKRAAPPPPKAIEEVRFGDFVFHLGRGELAKGGEIVRITERERDMLRILAEAPGETVPRLALAGNGAASERAVDVQVNRLRRKVERDPANPIYVQTVRGFGYRLVVTP